MEIITSYQITMVYHRKSSVAPKVRGKMSSLGVIVFCSVQFSGVEMRFSLASVEAYRSLTLVGVLITYNQTGKGIVLPSHCPKTTVEPTEQM